MSCAAGVLFACLCVLKSCFNAYVLSILEYCAPVKMLSAESHFGSLVCVVCSAERLYDCEFCCLGHRRKVSALC